MYRDSDEDPVVKYYDETLAISGKTEIEWYQEKVSMCGGPILDLACGTGRLSLLFARKGYIVTSIDISNGMLSIFKEKLNKEPTLKQKISIYNMSMHNFMLEKQYNTILCVDAFFHNLSIEDERRCLKSVRDHLAQNGRFFFNVHNYNPKFIEQCRESHGEKWTERKKYWIRNNSEQIVLEQALDINENDQLIITLLRFKRYNKKGDLLSLEHSKWITHYHTREHYETIIEETGLVVENIVGSYKNSPINENSQLIFQIKQNE